MNRRTVLLSGLCALAAVAAGCAPLSDSRLPAPAPPQLRKSSASPFDNPAGGSGGVVPAGAQQPADPNTAGKFDLAGGQPVGQPVASFQAPPAPAPQPLQQPRPVPGGPNMAPPPPPGPVGPGEPVSGNPHVRTDPTTVGWRMGLRPGEVPNDRVIELTRQLEFLLGQNRDLVARIGELERLGAGREQALVEAIREVEAAEAEVSKTRGTISAQQAELAALQKKIRQMEREDIELLQLVIAALEKALPPLRREP